MSKLRLVLRSRRAAQVAGLLAAVAAAASGAAALASDFDLPVTPTVGEVIELQLADTDGDGHLDAVQVCDAGSDLALVWSRGLGDGRFDAPLTVATGVSGLAVGDVNGDGLADALVGIAATASVGAAVGVAAPPPGTPGLAPPIESPAAGTPSVLALGDRNGDGDLDVAVSFASTSRVQLLDGDGSGAFVAHAALEFGTEVVEVVFDDLDGDDAPDLAVLTFEELITELLVVFASAGGFAPPVSWTTRLRELRAADMDGDGDAEIVAIDRDATGSEIVVVDEDGAGGPLVLERLSASGAAFHTVGDLDRDGILDVLVSIGTTDTGSRLAFMPGTGDGTLGPARDASFAKGQKSLALGDVDEDGAGDVVAGTASGLLVAGRGFGDGGFESYPPVFGSTVKQLLAGDLDGDGRAELLVGDTGLRVYAWGDGRRLLPSVPVDLPGAVAFLADLDDATGDDVPDLLMTVHGVIGQMAVREVLLVPGNGDRTFGAPSTLFVAPSVSGAALGDVDADDDLDAIVSHSALFSTDTITVLLNDGSGGFTQGLSYDYGSDLALLADDIDGNGIVEVFVRVAQGGIWRARWDDVGQPGPLVPILADDFIGSWTLADATGDRWTDVVAKEQSILADRFFVVEGGPNGFTGTTYEVVIDAVDFSSGLAVGEVTGDDLPDVLWTARTGNGETESGTWTVVPGLGDGAFDTSRHQPVAGLPFRFGIGDFDGDGVDDAASAIGSSSSILVSYSANGPWSVAGPSLAGAGGFSDMEGFGSLQANRDFGFAVRYGPPAASTILVLGTSVLAAPFKGGVLVPSPDVILAGLVTDANGELRVAGAWPPGVPAGLALVLQAWFVGEGGPQGLSSTVGVVGITP